MGIPVDSSVVIPRLFCRDPAAAMEFYAGAFEAVDLGRRPGPDGTVAHGLMTIGSAMIMIEREGPELPARAPTMDGSSPVVIFVYVADVDATVGKAAARGARLLIPATDQFWGDRTAWIMDPAGHVWTIATRIEEPTEEERRARWGSMLAERDRTATARAAPP